MEPPASLVRARELLARHTVRDLPDVAALSGPQGADSGRRSNPVYNALLEAAFLVAAADGQLAREEVGELADLISQMTSQAVSPGELADSIAAYSAQLEQSGRGAMIDALAASCSDGEVRRQVLGFAALVALCDRDLAPSELFVLHSLGKAFGLPAAEVNAIVRSLKSEMGMEGLL
jgi:tellurite resistance protein